MTKSSFLRPMPEPLTPEEVDERISVDQWADYLYSAWHKYLELFGEPPHGTLRQMSALIAFVPIKAVTAERRNKELEQAARALCEGLSEECADGLAPGPSISNAWANLLALLPKEERGE